MLVPQKGFAQSLRIGGAHRKALNPRRLAEARSRRPPFRQGSLTSVKLQATVRRLKIRNFAHKGLNWLYSEGRAKGVPSETVDKLRKMLACLDNIWAQYERIIKPSGNIVLTAAQPFTSILVASNLRLFRYEWIWKKSRTCNFLNAKKQPLRIHESILVFYKRRGTYNPQFTQGKPYRSKTPGSANKGNYRAFPDYETVSDGRRYPVSVLEVNNETKTNHPTAKPVALFEYLIKTYSNEGELVLDSCTGGGTTGVACDNTARRFIGFEMDQKYFEAARVRIADNQARLIIC
jgi:site-specific DNA-methyltransferase (adenine-specific)